ncbi:MAG TPA: protein kinase [Polyangiales bacterium]|nr:protein kinase [Polyangiales bacterium]
MRNSATVEDIMGSPPAVIGDVIADKYSVERIVGEGGMGVVYAARHLELDQRVAIKFLLPEIAQQGMAAERFRREARAAARIRGEHVCRVLDVGTLRGIPYMVMEYLDGRDLANELERRGRLPPEEAVGYVLEACDAVAEAHAAGIVHRDIKPANLFLATRSDGSRHVKVLDFGVSKSLVDSSSGQHALTVTSSVVGSPLYMSPEQLDSARDVDRRTDIWALGVVLFEFLTGRTPFSGDSIPQLVNSVLHDLPPSFASCEVTAPDGLEVALARALAKVRDQRYGSVAEFVSALAPYASRHGALSVRMSRGIAGTLSSGPMPGPGMDSQPIVTVGGARGSVTASRVTQAADGSENGAGVSQVPPAPWQQRTTDRGRRSRQGLVLGALVLLAGSGFLVYRFALQHDAGPPTANSTGSPGQPGTLAPAPTTPSPSEPKPSTAANTEGEKPAVEEPKSGETTPAVQTGAIAPQSAPGATATPAPLARPNLALPPHKPPPPRIQPVPGPSPVPARPAAPASAAPASPNDNLRDFGGRR